MHQYSSHVTFLGLEIADQLQMHAIELLLQSLYVDSLLLIYDTFNQLLLFVSEACLLLQDEWLLLFFLVSLVLQFLNVHHVDIFQYTLLGSSNNRILVLRQCLLGIGCLYGRLLMICASLTD